MAVKLKSDEACEARVAEGAMTLQAILIGERKDMDACWGEATVRLSERKSADRHAKSPQSQQLEALDGFSVGASVGLHKAEGLMVGTTGAGGGAQLAYRSTMQMDSRKDPR